MLKRSVGWGKRDVEVAVGCSVELVADAGSDVATAPSVVELGVASEAEHAPRASGIVTSSTGICLGRPDGAPERVLAIGHPHKFGSLVKHVAPLLHITPIFCSGSNDDHATNR
jgi:hypothetical protein